MKLGPFTVAEERAIRQAGGGSCSINATEDPPKVNTLAALRVVINVLDGDGNRTGETRVITRAVKLTITEVHAIIDGARQVDFKVGDWRDLDRYMARVSGAVTTPDQSIDRDAPMPPAGFVDELADRARQRDDARRATQRKKQTARSLAIRLKDAEKRRDAKEIRAISDEARALADQIDSAAA